MKGVSPLIAAVVLIAFTITIAFMVANWGTSFIQSQTEAVSSQIQCLGALGTGTPQFYTDQVGGTSKIAISVTNLNREIQLTNIKLSVFYSDPLKNLENIDTGITLVSGDTKTIVQDLVATEKPISVRVVSTNCPNAPKTAYGIVESLGAAPTTFVSTTETTSTAGTTTTTNGTSSSSTTSTSTSTTISTTSTSISTSTTSTTIFFGDDALIANYKFENNAEDYANDYDGTIFGAVSFISGKNGLGAYFTGSTINDYISIPNSVLNLREDITVMFWMKSSDSSGGILSGATSTYNNAFLIFDQGSLKFYFKDQYWNTGLSFDDGQWHHITFKRTGSDGQVYFYLNGNFVSTGSLSSGLISVSVGGLIIGQEQDSVGGGFVLSQAYSGYMDELRFYDRALNDTEIASIFNSQN